MATYTPAQRYGEREVVKYSGAGCDGCCCVDSLRELKSVLNVYQSKWANNSSLLPKPSIIGDKVAKHFSNASKII